MSDLIERLPEMLRKVAKTESDEGEYGITGHIDWMAADRIEHLESRVAELGAALQHFYDYGYDRGRCEQALGEDDE